MKTNGPWGANEPSSTQAPTQAKVEPKKATQRQVESESSDAYGSEEDENQKKVKKEKKAPAAENKIDSLIDIGGGKNQQ